MMVNSTYCETRLKNMKLRKTGGELLRESFYSTLTEKLKTSQRLSKQQVILKYET